MQTEYVYPALGDRSSPKEWEELGKPILVEEATSEKSKFSQNLTPGTFRSISTRYCAAVTTLGLAETRPATRLV